jgi:hypothetical protein
MAQVEARPDIEFIPQVFRPHLWGGKICLPATNFFLKRAGTRMCHGKKYMPFDRSTIAEVTRRLQLREELLYLCTRCHAPFLISFDGMVVVAHALSPDEVE